MDDDLELGELSPEERMVGRLLARRPDGYALNLGESPDGPRPWWKFWEPKQEDAYVAWRRRAIEREARRRRLQREPDAKA